MFDATVVIATKNRKNELQKAIESTMSQIGARIEILVMDDGSTDGTYYLLREMFPAIRVERHPVSLGYIVQRNRAAEVASGPLIISLDDDAVFSTPNVVRGTLQDFSDAMIGAVAIPWINVPDGENAPVRQKAPDGQCVYCANAFTGLAHAVRKDVFLQIGGYRENLVHGGEELEFCTRLLNAGYVTRLGTSDPVLHYESPVRNLKRQCYFGARSSVLYAWYNVPTRMLAVHMLATIGNHLQCGLRCGHLASRVAGVAAGLGACVRERKARKAISFSSYRLIRKMQLRYIPLDELRALVPRNAVRSPAQ